MAPFCGWGSTISRPQSLRGDSLLFTNMSAGVLYIHLFDLGRRKGWVNHGTTQWFRTRDNHFNSKYGKGFNSSVGKTTKWLHRHIQNPVIIEHGTFFKNSSYLKAVKYFGEKLHLRCLTEFWTRLWVWPKNHLTK